MPSLEERDRVLRESWVNVKYRQPECSEAGPHFSVAVMGVVDDPLYTQRGEKPFVEIVHWWPAASRFTITHAADVDGTAVVEDYPVNVTYWQPRLPLPWG